MKKLIINGINGKMGAKVWEYANGWDVYGVDLKAEGRRSHLSFDINDFTADVIIDFSSPDAIEGLLKYAVATKTPLVICSTGYSEEQKVAIKEASTKVPVFMSFNMSLGINVLSYLATKAASLLAAFDVEIVEKHHNQKLDAPSGTAIMLANAVKEGREGLFETYGREGKNCKRQAGELGMHAVRGGTIVGEHEIGFYGESERIVLSHSAENRDVFAKGAIHAATYMANQTECRMYDMNDVIKEVI